VILDSALLHCAHWLGEGLHLTVAVNLSVRDLLDPRLVDDVRLALQRHGLDARSLELEITESSSMVDPRRSMEVLGALAQLGVKLSIDDYGTGHSSLAYLQRLPVGRLKIDRSFVSGWSWTTRAPPSWPRRSSLRECCGSTSWPRVSRTTRRLLRLRDLRCHAAQGFGLGRPVAAPLIPELIRSIEERLPAVLGTQSLSALPGR
jgi:EAL domain-containing protein (putative c-di-GMP-specific phosphodiesterase class I)